MITIKTDLMNLIKILSINILLCTTLTLMLSKIANAQIHQDVMLLNGIVDYEQTELAFPPAEFKHKIQVPGLIDLAEPKIDQYDKYFNGIQELKYHWYRFKFKVPAKFEKKFAELTLLKSMYNTQIILNGYDCGTYMQCSTPIETNLTPYLKLNNEENILLVRVGEEKRLPRESALGYDREKFAYIPGIWDDVFISFSGPVRISRALVLTSYLKKEVTVKIKVENVSKIFQRNMEYAYADYTIKGFIREKKSGKRVTPEFFIRDKVKSQLENKHEIKVSMADPQPWSPENPFLYQIVLIINNDSITIDKYGNPENKKRHYPEYLKGISDVVTQNIGMRDFKPDGQFLALNGKRYYLAGSAITLVRFFEDKDRKQLPWNRKWVEQMFVNMPKALGWNTFRVCIGLLPRFWYDLADEYGFLLQNGYPMWQFRGSESEIENEYTDWVWSDGTHPSIGIWDALNEQKSDFIGNRLIPGLLKLDPSRIWDAGYMTDKEMKVQIMDSHAYILGYGWWTTDAEIKKDRDDYHFGNIISNSHDSPKPYPLLVNEYGWLWMTRDGKESGIRVNGEFLPGQVTPSTDDYEYYEPGGGELYRNRDIIQYYLGKDASAEERFRFQAYLLGIQSEQLRAEKVYTGILSFAYLANDRGYTGDWFMGNVADLKPSQALAMQYNIAKRFAVFIDYEDQRYNKKKGFGEPGSTKVINLFATNESGDNKSGKVAVNLIDSKGKTVLTKSAEVQLPPFGSKTIPVSIQFPTIKGGYLLKTELTDSSEKETALKQVSIRYLRVGNVESPEFYNYVYKMPEIVQIVK